MERESGCACVSGKRGARHPPPHRMQKRAKWVWVLASSIQLQVIPSLGVFNFIFPFPFLFLSLLSLSKVGGPNVSEAPPPPTLLGLNLLDHFFFSSASFPVWNLLVLFLGKRSVRRCYYAHDWLCSAVLCLPCCYVAIHCIGIHVW